MDLSTARHGFVTGGASGIGLAIAKALVSRGLFVTIADVNEDALAEACANTSGLTGVVLDTRDREGWARVRDEAQAARGPVDVLVNNAGIAPNGRGFSEMDPDSYDTIVAINLGGVANGVFAFAPEMRARGRGHILNTSSQAGLFATVPGVGAYAVAKFGVTALSESLRLEMEPFGVGVSVLCPGYVQTNLGTNTWRIGGDLKTYVEMPPSDVSAEDVGAMVIKGVEANAAYILTHEDAWKPIAKRNEAIRAACELVGQGKA